MIENRFVHRPESAPSLVQRPNALTAFAHGRHDDQVDAIAQNEPSDGG
jgi:phage terminase large subunit-like protein